MSKVRQYSKSTCIGHESYYQTLAVLGWAIDLTVKFIRQQAKGISLFLLLLIISLSGLKLFL